MSIFHLSAGHLYDLFGESSVQGLRRSSTVLFVVWCRVSSVHTAGVSAVTSSPLRDGLFIGGFLCYTEPRSSMWSHGFFLFPSPEETDPKTQPRALSESLPVFPSGGVVVSGLTPQASPVLSLFLYGVRRWRLSARVRPVFPASPGEQVPLPRVFRLLRQRLTGRVAGG